MAALDVTASKLVKVLTRVSTEVSQGQDLVSSSLERVLHIELK